MEKQIILITLICSFCLQLYAQEQPLSWQPPTENRPILIFEVKSFNDPVWVSVSPTMYKRKAINAIVEYEDIDKCPHTLHGWSIFQLDSKCYTHIYVSDMIRWLVYEMVDTTLRRRMDSVIYYAPPFDKDGISYNNLIYCRTPYKDFLIVYMTVNDYLNWAPRWQIDSFTKEPYIHTDTNTLYYCRDKKRHGLFLKFAIPLAYEYVRE